MVISFGQYHINNNIIYYHLLSFKMISPNQEEYSILNVQ